MEIQQLESTLIDEPSMIDLIKHSLNPNPNEPLLTTEKMSLTEEIKILIRKLWN